MTTPLILAVSVSRRAMVAPATRVWSSGMVAGIALEVAPAAGWTPGRDGVPGREEASGGVEASGDAALADGSSPGCWIRMILSSMLFNFWSWGSSSLVAADWI